MQFSVQIEFGPVETHEQMGEVHQVRSAAYSREAHILLEDGARETLRDNNGLVFLLRENGKPRATVRLVRLGMGISKLESLPHFPRELAPEPSWEISRLSVMPTAGATDSLRMLMISCRWLLEHTQIRHFYACCHGSIKRRYQLLGAQTVAGPFPMDNRKRDDYFIIKADLLIAARLASGPLETERLRPSVPTTKDVLITQLSEAP